MNRREKESCPEHEVKKTTGMEENECVLGVVVGEIHKLVGD